jgi:hydrogenase/urease accessory protein HupE
MRAGAFVVAAAVLLVSARSDAHGMRSAYLEIEAGSAGTALVRFRLSLPDLRAEPRLDHCALTPTRGGETTDSGEVRGYVARCDGDPTAGAISVTGLGTALDEASVLVHDGRGGEYAAVLTSASPTFTVPRAGDTRGVWLRYVGLGLAHIASGFDHLLFLLLIVVHLRRLRPILVTETAFSISHGLAFAATALGWIRVAPAPVEACIALSLVLLALDATRSTGPDARATAALALVFGVVHGLGFAGGLREVGVPEPQLAQAVLGFGIGVELGQVACVIVAWQALRWLGRLRWAPRITAIVVAGAGSLAMAWLIERTLTVLERS